MNDNVFVLGNGISRKNIDPYSLPGTVIGCNACYRDFKPDIICSTDAGIMSEIIDSGFNGDCYFTHDSWNLLPEESYASLANGTEHATYRRFDSEYFVYISGLDSGVAQSQSYIIWVPKEMEHKIKNMGPKTLGWSTGTSAVYVACNEWKRPCRSDGWMNGPKKVYLLGFDHKNDKYDSLYADTKHYFSKDSKKGWLDVHNKWSDQLYKVFKWYPNIEFYWVNYGGYETDNAFTENLHFLDKKDI
jgi:hypothetical protein